MAARKKSAKGKGAAKKKPAAKKKAPARKKVATKKAAPAAKAAASAPTKPSATPSPFAAPATVPAPSGGVRSTDVNRGHIFALHPKVNTGFSPQAFENARRELAERTFASIDEAARAVAERALELINQRPAREPFPST